MFTSEKKLVEKLVNDLQTKYDTPYIVKELRGGNNIADVAYTVDINRQNIVFDEYFNAYYYFNSIYNKKRIKTDEVGIVGSNANKKFYHFLQELEDLGYIKIEENYITSIKKIDAVTKNFIAVEAKLTDWKAGLEQAIRYKQFANEVYVAISLDATDKVDKQLFKDKCIGLMGVSEGELKIIIKAKKLKIEKLDIQYYIIDRFLKQLKTKEMIII